MKDCGGVDAIVCSTGFSIEDAIRESLRLLHSSGFLIGFSIGGAIVCSTGFSIGFSIGGTIVCSTGFSIGGLIGGSIVYTSGFSI